MTFGPQLDSNFLIFDMTGQDGSWDGVEGLARLGW